VIAAAKTVALSAQTLPTRARAGTQWSCGLDAAAKGTVSNVMHPTRILVAALVVAGCAGAKPPAPLPLPAAAPGTIEIAARALEPTGEVTVLEIAVTSEHVETLALDRKQVYARVGSATSGGPPQRIAPLGSSDAANRAGSGGLPSAARSSAYGAAEGGLRGAATGAVTGGGTGGLVGAAVGVIGGVFRGAQAQPPDVAGFEDRALPNTALRPGLSATGFVYFPIGDYREIEVVLTGEKEVVRMIVPVAPVGP
jgi:hypothetical protein